MVLDLLYVGGVTYGLWMLGNCVEIVRKVNFASFWAYYTQGLGPGGIWLKMDVFGLLFACRLNGGEMGSGKNRCFGPTKDGGQAL